MLTLLIKIYKLFANIIGLTLTLPTLSDLTSHSPPAPVNKITHLYCWLLCLVTLLHSALTESVKNCHILVHCM